MMSGEPSEWGNIASYFFSTIAPHAIGDIATRLELIGVSLNTCKHNLWTVLYFTGHTFCFILRVHGYREMDINHKWAQKLFVLHLVIGFTTFWLRHDWHIPVRQHVISFQTKCPEHGLVWSPLVGPVRSNTTNGSRLNEDLNTPAGWLVNQTTMTNWDWKNVLKCGGVGFTFGITLRVEWRWGISARYLCKHTFHKQCHINVDVDIFSGNHWKSWCGVLITDNDFDS